MTSAILRSRGPARGAAQPHILCNWYLVLGVNAAPAEKFGIIIPFGDFGDDLRAAFYAGIHINVRWEFAPLAAA